MRKTYRAVGIDCANCALKLENDIKKLDKVKFASVDFIMEKIIVEIDDDDFKDTIKKVLKLCKKFEPDIEIEEII